VAWQDDSSGVKHQNSSAYPLTFPDQYSIIPPAPRAPPDKAETVNAQFQAEGFNRKLGATLHAVLAGEFPPRR
jgi:hypothetical protein